MQLAFTHLEMLIEFSQIFEALKDYKITGVFHIGAHDCEEMNFYEHHLSVDRHSIIWIDALHDKVHNALLNGVPNVYQSVISDIDNAEIKFNITNNKQSSSILEFGTHAKEHPHIYFEKTITMKTHTIDSFARYNDLDMKKYNFWNLDIQGAELMALKGGTESLRHADAVYLEVNEAELYKDCSLLPAVDAFMADCGFTRVLMKMTVHKWGDALYVRTSHKV